MKWHFLMTLLLMGLGSPDGQADPRLELVRPDRRPAVMPEFSWEITIPSASRAAALFAMAEGFDWIEAPISRTKDGVLFVGGPVFRDGKALDPATLEWADVRIGSRDNTENWRFLHEPFLTLEEFLSLCKGSLNVRVLGDLESLKEAAVLVQRLDMERQVLFAGADPASLREAIGVHLPIEIQWMGDVDGIEKLMSAVSPSVISFSPLRSGHIDPTPEQVKRWRSRGILLLLDATFYPERPMTSDRQWEKTKVEPDILCTNQELTYLGADFRKRVPHRSTQICCHRGASRYAPENTRRAFQIAQILGADYVEFDVRTTSDGVPILMHDSALDRMTDGTGPVKNKPWSEVQRLVVAPGFDLRHVETVMSLDRFLETCDRSLKLYVDAKDIEPEALVTALKKHNRLADAVVYQGEDYLKRLKTIEPTIQVMPPLDDAASIERLARELQPHAVDASWRILSKELIDDCHARGIKVFSDALGLFERDVEYRKAINWGIDCIQTDHPSRVIRSLIEASENQ